MSLDTQQYVWEHSKQKGAARLVMVALADNANDLGDAFPGMERIAKRCNMSIRNLQLIIQKCERDNELIVFEQCGLETGNGKTNLYRIVRNDIKQAVPLDEKGIPLQPRAVKQPKKRTFAEGVKPVAPRKKGAKPVTPQAVKPDAPLGVKPVAPKQSVNGQLTEDGKPQPVKMIKSLPDALIDIWARETNQVTTEPYRLRWAAKKLLELNPPASVGEIETVCRLKMAGRTTDYEFRYLLDDIPLRRKQLEQQAKEDQRKAAAQAKMDEERRNNRIMWGLEDAS